MRCLKVVIAGGRDFDDFDKLIKVCDHMLKDADKIEIVSGGAPGADRLGEAYSALRGYDLHKFPAKWDLHGKSAGYKRNRQMAQFCDVVMVFWDGKSRGTKHMIDISKELNRPIHVTPY